MQCHPVVLLIAHNRAHNYTDCLWVQAKNPHKTALAAFPLLYGSSIGTVLALVLLKTQLSAAWPLWLTAVVSLAAAVGVAAAVQFFAVPGLRSGRQGGPQGPPHETPLVDLFQASSLVSLQDSDLKLTSL